MTNAVTHFEIYSEEPARLADFYSNVLGWQVDKAPGIDYWRIQTEAGGSDGFSGGLTYRPAYGLCSWMNYVSVASLDGVLAQAKELGGNVLRPKTAVPKAGWHAVLADPDGNIFAVWQPDPTAFPPFEPD